MGAAFVRVPVELVRSGVERGETFADDTALFDARPPSPALAYRASELEMLLTGGRDGGLFMVIGRRRR